MASPAPRRLNLAWSLGISRPSPDAGEALACAVALGDRLLDVEAESFALRAELARVELAIRSRRDDGAFEVPIVDHVWPLAQDPDRHPGGLAPYDRRVDDPVILEGRRGRDFQDRFGLTSIRPDFAAAAAAIAGAKPALPLIPNGAAEVPDVSIVIPIHGELRHTLNCLDSILAHCARYSAEILIVDDRSPDDSRLCLRSLPFLHYHLRRNRGGFIESCNTGARLARGRHLLFLNNDTRVVEGWLDALIDSFALFPSAGLVGSKLFYPDGSLQEAGAIIWRDGRASNDGRGDDPNRPKYCHARPVDYVSGCSIVLPTALWHDLGGFDPRYRPAYCEDADLCLSVAARGHEVWLQTESRVIHYEGKTAGTDTARGVKAYQPVNQRRLFLKWRERLEAHRHFGEAPSLERERSVRRRLLVIDATTPTPDQDAGSVQTVLAIGTAQAMGYKTHFVSAHNWLFQHGYTSELQKRGVECAYAPFDTDVTHYLDSYGPLFDVILVYRMTVLEPILEDIRRLAPQAVLLFHLADLHYLRARRQAELDQNADGLQEAAIIETRELALISAADCTITHSTTEAAILQETLPRSPVTVWPLMLDCFATQIGFDVRRDICFLGGYRHTPNVDAVMHFVQKIFPLIHANDPTIRFLIAGANATREVHALAGDRVEVVGLVHNLRDLFDRVRVFVCPLRFGAGVKGKVLSALSYGVPVVSTSIGIEGSSLEPGRHVLLADSAPEFAAETLHLHSNIATWNRLSVAGQKVVAEKFSPAAGPHILGGAIEQALRHKLGLDDEPARWPTRKITR